MTKSEYVEKLRQRAADIVDEGYILIEEIADELEAMDVVWVPRHKFTDWFDLIDTASGSVGRAMPNQRSEPEWNDLLRAKAALERLDDDINNTEAAENTND